MTRANRKDPPKMTPPCEQNDPFTCGHPRDPANVQVMTDHVTGRVEMRVESGRFAPPKNDGLLWREANHLVGGLVIRSEREQLIDQAVRNAHSEVSIRVLRRGIFCISRPRMLEHWLDPDWLAAEAQPLSAIRAEFARLAQADATSA